MTPVDLLLCRFLLASAGCIAAGMGVWALTSLLRRWPGFALQRSTWLLGQITIVAVFLVILLPHSERLRLVPPIELSEAGTHSAVAAATPAAAVAAATLAPAPSAATAETSWLAYGARAWLGVYLLGLGHALYRLLRARQLLLGLAAAGRVVRDAGGDTGFAAAQSGARLQMIEVDAPISPMLFGLFRPRLLLPGHLRSFDADQRQMIVEHELTHLRRGDLRWMSAGIVLQTLVWFNPFMRMLRARLSWAQELGCDRDVLAGRPRGQRKAYAAALVAQLRTQHCSLHAALAFGGVSASTVAERIALIREPAALSRSRWVRSAAYGGLALIFAGSLAFQPALAWRIAPLPTAAVTAHAPASAGGLIDCTVLADAATGAPLVQQGQCDQRVTPASTFNVAVSLMGYDSGILVDEHQPSMPYKRGYASWNPAWHTTTNPTSWFSNSVVWYTQQVTARLGEERFQQYAKQFNYGNQDVSGDPGKDNGLALAWISSSLKISPLEQVAFMRNIVNRQLPVSAKAYDMTARVMVTDTLANGWVVQGKTGTANPVLSNGKDDAAHSLGWYVGWAKKGQRTVVFARLILDKRQKTGAAGLRTKKAFLRDLPKQLDAL